VAQKSSSFARLPVAGGNNSTFTKLIRADIKRVIVDIQPVLYFLLLVLIMFIMYLLVCLSDALGKEHALYENMLKLEGKKEEEPPEWL
jgi:hypothetical protein